MDDEIDFDLSRDQWETLKTLRAPATKLPAPNQFVIEDLVGLGLVAIDDGVPLITRNGRRALIRGSFRLWDLAA